MSAHVLLIDNYDSFSYNLVQALAILGARVTVRRNDEVTVANALEMAPTHLVVSPGPGRPEDAGVSIAMVSAFMPSIPVLGVCLGHQAIGAAFGGRIVRARELMHGKTSLIHHTGKGVFDGLPDPFTVIRYHSLAIERASLPQCLEVTAETADGEIMGVRHRSLPIEGVQFHPESILTEHGHALLRNFLRL